MLSSTVNRNETLGTATQRTRSELALLHGVVVSVEAGLNRLLRLAAEWVCHGDVLLKAQHGYRAGEQFGSNVNVNIDTGGVLVVPNRLTMEQFR